jgi:diguanylate cyclase (GGDEF)-like protein
LNRPVAQTTLWAAVQIFFGLLVHFSSALFSPALAAQDLVVSREYFKDETAQLSIAEIQQASFRPVTRRISEGFSPAAHWLRITVAPSDQPLDAILRLRPTFLDDVQLYEPNAQYTGGWSYRQAGDRHPPSAKPESYRSFSFRVKLQDKPSVFYLRVVTSSTLWADVTVMSPIDTRADDRTLELIQIVYLTVMAMVFLWAVIDFFQSRQKLVGLFALHQLGLAIYSMAIFGYHMHWVPSQHAPMTDLITSVAVISTGIFFLIFSYQLFRDYLAHRYYQLGMLALIGFSVFNLGLLLLGYNGTALSFNAYALLVGWAYMFIVALRLPPTTSYGRNHIRVAYGAIFGLMLFFQTMVLGVFPMQVPLVPLLALFVYGVVGSMLFWSLMLARSKLLQRELDRADFELKLSEKTLALEKELRAKALDEARTDYLTGVLSRRWFTEICKREITRAIRYKSPLTLMLIDIDHFKAVNDHHGHLVGDQVIQNVAACLQKAVRDVDVVGRVGGEEFGVLLIEADTKAAMAVAQRMHKNLEDSGVQASQSQAVKATISIGLCSMSEQIISFEALFSAADQALYQAKQAGRNTTAVADQKTIT